jgi:hypothetical protein
VRLPTSSALPVPNVTRMCSLFKFPSICPGESDTHTQCPSRGTTRGWVGQDITGCGAGLWPLTSCSWPMFMVPVSVFTSTRSQGSDDPWYILGCGWRDWTLPLAQPNYQRPSPLWQVLRYLRDRYSQLLFVAYPAVCQMTFIHTSSSQ